MNMNGPELRSYEPSPADFEPEFSFADPAKDIEAGEAPTKNPEAYSGCLVAVMRGANRGSDDARREVASTIVDADGNGNVLMACGRCGINLVRFSEGITYGANSCPDVRSGKTNLGELA